MLLCNCILPQLIAEVPSKNVYLPTPPTWNVQVTGGVPYHYTNKAASKNVNPDLLESCGSAKV